MFGDHAFGDAPFCSLNEPFVLLGATASLAIDFNYRLYAGSRAFITESSDAPPNTPFNGTIDQALSFSWSILGSQDIGQFTAGHGTVTLVNTDGKYDNLPTTYAVDGREVIVKIGRCDDNGKLIDAYSDFLVLARLSATGINPDESVLTINVTDRSYKLVVPFQANTYGGTGGVDGGSDLLGKRKPRGFGQVWNASPPLVVANSLVYQLNDGAIHTVLAVYDRGAALIFSADYPDYASLIAAVIPAGDYASCIALGLIRLQSSPAGTVTVDFQGDSTGSGYVETTQAIIRRVIGNSTSLVDPDDLYLPSFTDIAADNGNAHGAAASQQAPVGYWTDHNDTSTVADCVARLMAGIGGWGGFRRSGQFEIGVVLAPTGVPSSRFGEGDIIDRTISRLPLPGIMSPPPWRLQVGYQRNETVQTDLAGSVDVARRLFVVEKYRSAVASSSAILIDHPQAQDLPVHEAYFARQADAQTEANRLLALYRSTRSLYKVKLNWPAFDLNIGEISQVTFPRWDLSAGRLLLVCALTIDGQTNTVEMVGYG